VLWPPGIVEGVAAAEGTQADYLAAGESLEPGPSAASAASDPALGLRPGDLVPVYVKSLIRDIFVVGVPANGQKAEVKQWRLEFFSSRAKAKAYLKGYSANAYAFAVATRNGLEIREKPSNLADTAYRLRSMEVIKLLRKVQGQAVETGGRQLEGDWWLALACDGTRGYVFSNTLRVFDPRESTAAQAAVGIDTEARDASIDLVMAKTWRPEYMKTMIEEGRYDLKDFDPRYGLFFDLETKRIRVELPQVSRSFPYDAPVRLKPRLFGFNGNAVRVQIRADDLITLEFPLADGRTRSEIFVTLDADIVSLARQEEARRQALLEGILARGRILASDAYGSLVLAASRRFIWTGYGLLSPLIIPEGAGESGEIAFDAYVDGELGKSFAGVMSFYFDGLARNRPVRFYYALTADGLRLEQVPEGAFDPIGLLAKKRAIGPVVAFFSFSS
jgi:hypothetical protein